MPLVLTRFGPSDERFTALRVWFFCPYPQSRGCPRRQSKGELASFPRTHHRAAGRCPVAQVGAGRAALTPVAAIKAAACGRANPSNAVSAMAGPDHSKHTARHPDLLDAMNNRLDKGRCCITHCFVSYQESDLELADCAAKVHEMQAIGDAFSCLASIHSEYIKAYVPVCEQACNDRKSNVRSTRISSSGTRAARHARKS